MSSLVPNRHDLEALASFGPDHGVPAAAAERLLKFLITDGWITPAAQAPESWMSATPEFWRLPSDHNEGAAR
ncbi:hypothetical protein [Nocardia sp. NPDC127526]|uniref:hypothetical protein n=1 Tax=Nocardia sp. NPDC127526 TaxID=3345393 RepID=UPI0036418A3E